ncbi:oxidoreductase [Microtetraspora sp. NBRC 13810]|uniref:quinone oxidoreductase family protein n=1 Tax=Microtetraspora sp. NBRC 13810 TaxID=3030990 RepID=UPI0024A34F1A|nr:NADP-dependent oxidoreductase [Microtetraspora sp. NBRC 13810]GLW10442.1 oxidoreductase [Microtetraspora sp. NBRC 13810]
MSKAIGFFEPGGPEVLRLIEVDEPQAGPGQVRVRVKAAGVQPYDVAVVEGWVPAGVDPGFPRIPGNEFAGVVDRVGAGVTGFLPGDEVLGYGRLNGYAEQVVVPAGQITAKPPAMSWEVAGGFPAGALNAYVALRELGVGAGDTVLIHGAAGAVGAVAVQLARRSGATVVATAREAQHDYLRALGALPVGYGDGFTDRVRALAPEGVDASLDGVGGEALDATLDLVKDRDRILTLVEHGRAAELGIRTMPPDRSPAWLAELADLYARGELTVHVRATFPLSRAADALRAYQAGNGRGKIVILVD